VIYRYLSILLAVGFVIVGLQLPGFLGQYIQRVDAHLAEVTVNLAGFQRIADTHHGGSLAALIAEHRASTVPTFVAEADVILEMVSRRDRFLAQEAGLATDLAGRIAFVVMHSDPELRQETVDAYDAVVVLNQDTATCAGILLIVGLLLTDLVSLIISGSFAALRRWTAGPKSVSHPEVAATKTPRHRG
jgi:hypothetical protein